MAVLMEPLEPRSLLAAESAFSTFSSYPRPDGRVVADINGDGTLDTAVVNAAGFQVRYKRPSGLEAVFDVAVDRLAGSDVEHLAVGDFDDDGRLDIAVSTRVRGPLAWTAPGAIEVFSSRVGGVFVLIGSVPAKGVLSLAAGSFDGDDRDELIVTRVLNAVHTPTTMEVRRYIVGNGQVRSAGRLFHWTGILTSPIVSDVDGDGKTDVLIGVRAWSFLGDANVQLLHGQGDGTFVQTELYRFSTPAAIQGLSVGDVDGDGRKDVAIASWHGGTGSLSYLGAQPGGGFASPTARTVIFSNYEPFLPVDLRSQGSSLGGVFAIGDFDHDGRPDIRLHVRRHLSGPLGQWSPTTVELYKVNLESDGLGGFTPRTELLEVA